MFTLTTSYLVFIDASLRFLLGELNPKCPLKMASKHHQEINSAIEIEFKIPVLPNLVCTIFISSASQILILITEKLDLFSSQGDRFL